MSSRLPPRYNIFRLGQEESGERSLIDGLPSSFWQTNCSSDDIKETADMLTTEEHKVISFHHIFHFIIEQEASGERSER